MLNFYSAAVVFHAALMGIVFLSFLGYSVFMLDSMFGGRDFATSELGVKKIGEILRSYKKDNAVFYDFGSARGGLILDLLKICPKLQATGFDTSRLRTFWAKILSRLTGRHATFVRQDIFLCDVTQADAVFVYLDNSLMQNLQDKLQKELKPGSLVITSTKSFPTWQPTQIYVTHPEKQDYEKMYVYEKD